MLAAGWYGTWAYENRSGRRISVCLNSERGKWNEGEGKVYHEFERCEPHTTGPTMEGLLYARREDTRGYDVDHAACALKWDSGVLAYGAAAAGKRGERKKRGERVP